MGTTNSVIGVDSASPLEGGNDRAPVRAHIQRVRLEGQPFTVLALRSLRAADEASESFARALAVAIPLVLILAGMSGYLLARASLAPVVAMGRQAERISAYSFPSRRSWSASSG